MGIGGRHFSRWLTGTLMMLPSEVSTWRISTGVKMGLRVGVASTNDKVSGWRYSVDGFSAGCVHCIRSYPIETIMTREIWRYDGKRLDKEKPDLGRHHPREERRRKCEREVRQGNDVGKEWTGLRKNSEKGWECRQGYVDGEKTTLKSTNKLD